MTMLAIAGFDFGDRGMFDSQSGLITNSATTPYSYGRAISGSTGGGSISKTFSNAASLFIGFAFYPDSNNPGATASHNLTDGGTIQVHFDVDLPNRRVSVYRGSGTSNLLAQSAVNSLPPVNNYFYLELAAVINNTTGSVEVRCDGVTICSASGVNTRATANNQANGFTLALPTSWKADDFYLLNNSGSTNNTFLGRQRVMVEFPVAEDAPIDFTPLSGTDNALMVDDPIGSSHDSDTTYNSLAAATGKDKFTVTADIPAVTVNAVALRNTFKKTDAATCTARALYATSGADQVGQTVNPGTSYVTTYDLFDQDLTDGANWTQSKVNGMKIGYERLS